MNYEKIQKLSHKTEDALDLIRNNKLQVDSEIMDLIFKCFDGIGTMVEQIAEHNMTGPCQGQTHTHGADAADHHSDLAGLKQTDLIVPLGLGCPACDHPHLDALGL